MDARRDHRRAPVARPRAGGARAARHGLRDDHPRQPQLTPLVIAIHGAVANAATWLPLQRSLTGVADVQADDLPGHGTRRGEPFVLEAAIAEIVRAVEAAAAQRRVVLAGDSLGGYLALAAAAASGAALTGVVAGSCAYPMRGPAAALARLSLVADVLTSEAPFVALTRAIGPPDVADAIVARGFAPRMRGITLRALLGRDVPADIAAIAAPITFVTGAYDIPIVWWTRAMARCARAGTVAIVPNAGHGVGFTHPAAFAAAIRRSLGA